MAHGEDKEKISFLMGSWREEQIRFCSPVYGGEEKMGEVGCRGQIGVQHMAVVLPSNGYLLCPGQQKAVGALSGKFWN